MAQEQNEMSPATADTMTKADLVDTLFDRMGLSKREAKLLVDVFFDEIRSRLEMGNAVKLSAACARGGVLLCARQSDLYANPAPSAQ